MKLRALELQELEFRILICVLSQISFIELRPFCSSSVCLCCSVVNNPWRLELEGKLTSIMAV